MLNILILLILGILCLSDFLKSRLPAAGTPIDMLQSVRSWIGLVAVIWGIWRLIHVILGIGSMGAAPLSWLLGLLTALVIIAAGFVLAFELLHEQLLSRNEKAKEGGKQAYDRLSGHRQHLGFLAIGLAVWALLSWLFFAGGAVSASSSAGTSVAMNEDRPD